MAQVAEQMAEGEQVKGSPERILCAAIHFDDGKEHPLQPRNVETGFVVCGWRHGNCFALIGAINAKLELVRHRTKRINKETQGFLTSYGRFVTRAEAARLAFKAGQIGKRIKTLFSEDLY